MSETGALNAFGACKAAVIGKIGGVVKKTCTPENDAAAIDGAECTGATRTPARVNAQEALGETIAKTKNALMFMPLL
jgi:hypothetical protein